MKALWLLIAIAPLTVAGTWALLPGTESAAPPAKEASTSVSQVEVPKFLLEWKGFHKLGVADRFAHTYETEPLVAPVTKAGTKATVPIGVTTLEFEVRWTGDSSLHLMVHGPMKADHSMPTYMTMGGKDRMLCLRVPVEQVEPGTWEVMTHPNGMGPMTIDFTIAIRGEGTTGAKLLEGPHGHRMLEDWSADMNDHEKCAEGPGPA